MHVLQASISNMNTRESASLRGLGSAPPENSADLFSDSETPSIPTTLMKELVAFDELGTQAKVSDALHLTQPAVTRGLRQFESILGVHLFDRSPNRTSLTPVGKAAAQQCRVLLGNYRSFVESIRNLERISQTLVIGGVIPGPLMLTRRSLKMLVSLSEDSTVSTPDHLGPLGHISVVGHLISSTEVIRGLDESRFELVLTNDEIFTDSIESAYLGSERLSVCFNEFSPWVSRSSVTFQELAGMTFLVADQIGVWRDITEKHIPDAKFVYQQDLNSMRLLASASTLPTFLSNLSAGSSVDDDRVSVPVEGPGSHLDVYAAYEVRNKRAVTPFISFLQHQWPQEAVRGHRGRSE